MPSLPGVLPVTEGQPEEELAREGAHVIVSGRDKARGAEVIAAIGEAGGTAEFARADLASADDVRALAARAADVDVLVNNAGIVPGALTHELPESVFDQTFAVNVKAPYLLTAAIAPADGRARRRLDR